MNCEYYRIKDHCRKGLLKYLERAVSVIPKMDQPNLLDVGCGSGVPTLFLLEKLGGQMTAVDADPESLHVLKSKINKLQLLGVNLIQESLFDLGRGYSRYDVILAEGLLNVVGFQLGFLKLLDLVKEGGYIIIHDDCMDQELKMKLFKQYHCEVLKMFTLEKQIWWEDYYSCLEEEIGNHADRVSPELFETELREIRAYKEDSSEFRSVYYVLQWYGGRKQSDLTN